jgi:1,4-dihydroxy-2-naphthoyl-CoA hydrolase
MLNFKKRISFYDCDPAGILFYGRIFELCHSAYEDLIRSFDLKTNYWNNDEYAVPIIHTEGEYLLPLKPGDEVTVEVTVSKLKESSFELSYACKNAKGEITNQVKTVHIFVDKKKWKKTPIIDEVRTGLQKHAG